MDDFILRALLAGTGLSLITGIIGCFVVWRKMSYFGDSLSHSALLGVALGLLFGIDINWTILLVAAVFAVLLTYMENKQILSTDTILGILAHGSLAMGLIVIGFVENQDIDLHDFLFGDILTVSWKDITYIITACVIVYFVMLTNWKKFIMLTISRDLAGLQGINNFRYQLLFIFLMALTISVSIKIIGALLVTSMLIIPAAASRNITNSPITMCICAIIIGILSVCIGILLSYNFNTPSGPSIVLAAIGIFITLVIGKLFHSKISHFKQASNTK
ncbi:MAG: iron chelate uptake ABC transporter family permease subunit [Rickettsiales bacterium]|nr:iron chelate uptake ABC transporter family permease subunit [Rickettsiales bacterium]